LLIIKVYIDQQIFGVKYVGFIQETHGDIIIEVVNLQRATLNDANDIKQTLFQDIESGLRKIVVDLTECEFIDSTFLGALVISLKKITALKGDLRLVIIQPAVITMFQLTRMNQIFEFFETKEEAIKSFI
jgi:anti-anti-sigma factor